MHHQISGVSLNQARKIFKHRVITLLNMHEHFCKTYYWNNEGIPWIATSVYLVWLDNDKCLVYLAKKLYMKKEGQT